MKSNTCLEKNHNICLEDLCECYCHHNDSCECFACKIHSINFGEVPGGYRAGNPSKPSKKEDF